MSTIKLWCSLDSDNGTVVLVTGGKCTQGYDWVPMRMQGNLMYYISLARMNAGKAYIGYVVD